MNTTTGALTEVGSGLNTGNPLALVSSGTELYGIDAYTAIGVVTNPAIYTIDTTTGVATTIGTVSGLDYGYTLDTMAPHAPAITPTSGTFVQNNAMVNFDATLTSLGGELYITGGTANLGSNSVNLARLNLDQRDLDRHGYADGDRRHDLGRRYDGRHGPDHRRGRRQHPQWHTRHTLVHKRRHGRPGRHAHLRQQR